MQNTERIVRFFRGYGRKALFPLAGFVSLIWFLVRVIPKPGRAAYPCMKVAAPLASVFVLYLLGVSVSVASFIKSRTFWRQSRYALSIIFILTSLILTGFSFLQFPDDGYADNSTVQRFEDPLGPNVPIGEAKGIFPGRVVWMYDPTATNKHCQPDVWGDGYFLDKNCDQDVVDDMFSKGIRELTDAGTDAMAWEQIFRHFNLNHDKGDVGYSDNESIFIKINAVHAWTTEPDASIINDENYGNVDTSPQAIMTMLRQLVYEAGVPQNRIYLGDPYTNIFKHIYEKLNAEFPAVNYVSRTGLADRTELVPCDTAGIYYSDKATVMDEITEDAFYTCMMEAAYLINIPAYKGHRWGGVTFFAKNHFGSNTQSSASRLHKGLHRTGYDQPLRTGYGKYRVFVDLMGSKNLGGKTLLYFMDGLWGTSEEHLPPTRFQSAPFNNDWSSSLFLSLDPVAIESVCLDIMQKEFTEDNETVDPPRYAFVQWDGIDDYLHQAASSAWWPDGIQYDPGDDGVPLASLGVHEHWNNPDEMLYSRDMETGDGIELVKIFQGMPTLPDDTLRVVCIGNSITAGALVSNPATLSYPALLDKWLGDLYDVRNFAVGGRTLLKNGDFPIWDEPGFEDALEFDPDIVIILLGTNDSKPQNWDPYHDEFIPDYLAMIDTFIHLDNNAQFIIGYPPPAFSNMGDIRDSVIFHGVLPAIDAIAAQKNVHTVDFYHAMLEDGDLFSDGIHPGDDGHEKMAELLEPVVLAVPVAVDSIPPWFSKIPASPLVVYDTAAVWLEVETAGPATVRYGETDQPYDAMASVFSQTGGRVHRTLIRGQHNVPLTLYLQAMDGAQNTTEFSEMVTIHFDTSLVRYSWNDGGYNTEDWSAGATPMGNSSDAGIVTRLDTVQTVYLRKTITAENPESLLGIAVFVKGRDGAVVYLNGKEVGRVNMQGKMDILYETPAEEEKTLNQMVMIKSESDLKMLKAGENLIAVEMHTATPGTPDLVFDSQCFDNTNRIYYTLGSEWLFFDGGLTPEDQLVEKGSGMDVTANGFSPYHFELQQNFPNPFNPVTTIRYTIPVYGAVSLDIFDVRGSHVARLINEKQSAGSHAIRFDGNSIASGIYFYRLRAMDYTRVKRMLLVK